jgi:hypothetical protein
MGRIFLLSLACSLVFWTISVHAANPESSPKLVEILHGSEVHVTQPSLSRSSPCSSLVAGPHGAGTSADSP